MPTVTPEVVWHDDGHSMILVLTKSEVSISMVRCPNGSKPGAACYNDRCGCVVNWFLMHYGLECHVGVSAPEEEMIIAWTLVGNPHDIESCDVWVISVNDMIFSSWAAAQQ